MKKKNIFEKIDTAYTKVVKVIIGDLPLQELKPKNNNSTEKNKNVKQVKYIYSSLKDTFLNMGTPENEKDLLYAEVAKKEKERLKESKKIKNKKRTTPKQKSSEKSKQKYTTKNVSTSKEESSKNTNTDTKKAVKKPITKKTKTSQSTQKVKTKNAAQKTTKTSVPSYDKKEIPKKSTTKKKSNKDTKPGTKNETESSIKNKEEKSAKPKSALRGAKKAEKIALYIKDIKKHYGEVDEAFVAIIVKNLGPSIYKTNSELVSCSDPKELDTVRNSFLKKKLGIKASKGVLDAAIQDVCIELKGVRKKYRATFYYALAKKFKKESVLS